LFVSIDYSAPYLLTADRWSLSTTFFFLGILNVRYKREDVKIQAWENHETRKAETEMKKVQASLISDALDYFGIYPTKGALPFLIPSRLH
jgi:hypothetical protein